MIKNQIRKCNSMQARSLVENPGIIYYHLPANPPSHIYKYYTDKKEN